MSDFRQLCRWPGVILDTCMRISTAATEPSNLRIRGSMAGCHRGADWDFAPAKLAAISATFGIITGPIGVMVDLPTRRHARDFLFGGLWLLVHDHCAVIA